MEPIFTLKNIPPEKAKHSALIIGIHEEKELTPAAQRVDALYPQIITRLLHQGFFTGKIGDTFPLFVESNHFQSILLVGCGKKSDLTFPRFRQIANVAMKAQSALYTTTHVLCYLTELNCANATLPSKVRQIVEATYDSYYSFDELKSEKKPASLLKEITLFLEAQDELKASELALQQALAIAKGVSLTKNLANLPSNICTPSYLAETAKQLAQDYPSIKARVLEKKDMEQEKMGALLAVAKGSILDPKFICLHYEGAEADKAPVVLIGKSVTFDTGGYSLKLADSMVGMKYDMCGGATVLGVLHAVAILKLPLNLIGIVPAMENCVHGDAYKPEDVLTSMSGKTIEVLSTDAEGRLILADALTYCERYNPAVVIDIATLTGAVVIALGHHVSGLFSADATLTSDLLRAGNESNDRVWSLPLWDEYQDQLKSSFADMSNLGGRVAGAITAACFLARFAKAYRWAHLDVAGTAAIMMGNAERRATGRPVPLLVQYLLNFLESPS